MSIVVRFPPSNVSKDQYYTVRNALEESGNWPADGCQLHVMFGDSEDVRVSEVWDSQAKFEAFGERLMPILTESGVELAGPPEIIEIHNIIRR